MVNTLQKKLKFLFFPCILSLYVASGSLSVLYANSPPAPSLIAVASFVANSYEVRPNDIVYFTNISIDATGYEWQLDGNVESTMTNYDYTFTTEGVFEVSLIAFDALCSDTFSSLITVSESALAQVGMPSWPVFTFDNPNSMVFDWRKSPPEASAVTNTSYTNKSKHSAGYNNCGELAFIVFHNGLEEPNNLFCYSAQGVPLITDVTASAPGLNAVGGTGEIQVIKVPETSDQWYIIYSEWSAPDFSSNLYNPAKILYSRIELLPSGAMNVLQRDVELVDNNGTANYYLDGKAVSRTANGNLNQHYLYTCRRNIDIDSISLDRFIIDNTGISFEANTGDVYDEWWLLSVAQSAIEISPREDIIAVNVRNASVGDGDIYLFDAELFNNTNYQVIDAEALTLVADGGPNDISNILPNNGVISDIANAPTSNLQFLQNIGRKISGIEFSPNGRFLYFINGGYTQGGITYIVYLAQIDLETFPYEVRLQIQTTPENQYNPQTGSGCVPTDCQAPWYVLRDLETAYDGNLYFAKSGGMEAPTELFVISDPNNFMPQNLTPSDISLGNITEPNIQSDSYLWGSPDQIDGFNYLNLQYREVPVIVTKLDCDDTCAEAYVLDLKQQGELITSFNINQCPDTIYVCVDTLLTYELVDPATNLSFSDAIIEASVNYPTGSSVLDFSFNEGVVTDTITEVVSICQGDTISIFNELVFEAGEYIFLPLSQEGCDTLFITEVVLLDGPTIDLEITEAPCDSDNLGVVTSSVNGGTAPYQYLWDFNSSTTSSISEVPPGDYNLTVTDNNGCSGSSNVQVNFLEGLALDIETSDLLCSDDQNGSVIINDTGINLMYSLDGINFQTDPFFGNLSAGTYELFYGDSDCVFSQSFEIISPSVGQVLLPADTTIDLGNIVEISSITNLLDSIQYVWTPTEGLSCIDCPDPIATPLFTTLYTLSVIDTNGCVVNSEMLITVLKDRGVYIPNAFSPNGDGVNDRLLVYAGSGVNQVLKFRIFDRWGELVFEDNGFQPNDPTRGWDGYFKGETMQTGVFAYYAEIEFADGVVLLYKGDFSIVR